VIVELVVEGMPKLDLKGYEKIELPNGLLFFNPVERRIEVVVKRHPDGKVSVFTDKSEIIEEVVSSARVIDVNAK